MTDPATPDGDVTFEVVDGVGVMTLSRPAARNAITVPMYRQLKAICEGIAPGGAVSALIVRGAGDKAFAAGTDIAHFRDFSTPEHALAYEREMDGILTALETCPVPTIAAIAGACTGGGAAIAACCDIRMATPSIRFGIPIAKTLGNCLSMGTLARLSSLMGPARVKDMVLSARLIEADEALAVGIVTEIAPDFDALMGRAHARAADMGRNAPLTLRATKEAMRRLRPQTAGADSDLITMCYMSADFREGQEAFLAKRPPRWQGR
ncbi:MAG: enoyl-CoA hydratase [Hyphomicrobiaceae bacterium]|nr:enoyl-CoA hydratase [Hyphomicrobiaceae bacterium]